MIFFCVLWNYFSLYYHCLPVVSHSSLAQWWYKTVHIYIILHRTCRIGCIMLRSIWQPHFYDIFFDFINSWGYCSSKYLWSGMHPHFQLNSPKTNIISSYIVYCYMHLLRYTKVSTCIQYWNRRGYTNLVRESFEIEPIAHIISYKNSSKHRKLTRGIRIK